MNTTSRDFYIEASRIYAIHLAGEKEVSVSWGSHEDLLSYDELVSLGRILQQFVDKVDGWVKLEVRHTFDDEMCFAHFSFGKRNGFSSPRIHV